MGSCGGGASFLGRKSGGLRDLAPLHLGKTRNLEWKPALRTAIPASASWRDRGSQGNGVFLMSNLQRALRRVLSYHFVLCFFLLSLSPNPAQYTQYTGWTNRLPGQSANALLGDGESMWVGNSRGVVRIVNQMEP